MKVYAEQGMCPACGRFAGKCDVCEYCGADQSSGDLSRIVRQIIALAAVLGLAALWVAGRGPRIETLKASEISPEMNNAVVSITGSVASRPYVGSSTGRSAYVSFLLSDHTRNIRVCLQGEEAEEFKYCRRAQQLGALLEVKGVLVVRKGTDPRLYVREMRGMKAWILLDK